MAIVPLSLLKLGSVNPTKMENPRKDEDVAREFRAFILDIWTKINEDDKFLMFRTLQLKCVEDQDHMNLETIHKKLNNRDYFCMHTGFLQ